jgi:hypothetical protein
MTAGRAVQGLPAVPSLPLLACAERSSGGLTPPQSQGHCEGVSDLVPSLDLDDYDGPTLCDPLELPPRPAVPAPLMGPIPEGQFGYLVADTGALLVLTEHV